MKKAFTVTISSRVFYVDEDAYHRLDTYLQSIRSHYGTADEGREILADIEASIAEKFSGLGASEQRSVTLADVEGVLAVLGEVEQFSQEAPAAAEPAHGSAGARKLYRNPDDAVVAGVCSGLAAYFGVDTLLVRLVFVLLAFANGVGVLLYLVLWAAIQPAKTSGQKLAMQGEPASIRKIEEAVRERAQAVRDGGRRAMDDLQQRRGWLYRLLNVPVVVLAAVWRALRAVLKVAGPALSITVGVVLIIGMLASVLGLTVGTGLLLFYTSSPYVVSDLPLAQLVTSAYYQVGVVSSYVVALVPVLFLLLAGFTLATLRNFFRPVISGVLIGIWMLSVAGVAVAAANLAPTITSHLAEQANQERVTRTYDYDGFSRVHVAGEINVTAVPSTTVSVTAMGRAQDLDRLDFSVENGELRVTQRSRQQLGVWCVVCLTQPVLLTVTGPQVEVVQAARPGEQPAVEPGWQTTTTSAGTFQYPEKLSTAYTSTVDWPPVLRVSDSPFTCNAAGAESSRAGRTVTRTVGSRAYCVTAVSEGAAGSVYTRYAYAWQRGAGTAIFTFTVRQPSCVNYSQPQRAACEREREAFDLDSVVDRMVQTVQLR